MSAAQIVEDLHGRVVQVLSPAERVDCDIPDRLDEFAGDRYVVVLHEGSPDLIERLRIYLNPFASINAPRVVTPTTNVRAGDVVAVRDATQVALAGDLDDYRVYRATGVLR